MKLDDHTIRTIKDMRAYYESIQKFAEENPKRRRIALIAYDTYCGCLIDLLTRILKENSEYRIFIKIGKKDMRFKENRRYGNGE